MRGRFNGRVIGQDYTGRNTRHHGRAGVYNAVQSAFAPSLDITLANGLGPLFTYTRATTATVTDFEGLIKGCLSGELRIQGARRVQNWLTNSTDSSTWSTATSGTGTATKTDNYGTAPDGTLTAARLVATKGSGYGVVRIPKTGTLPGTAIQQTCWIKSNTAGSQNVELGNVSVAYTTVTVTPTWKRLTPGVQTVSAGGANSLEIGAGGSGADASIDILIWHPQMEDVTGQSNQNPSEYVSVGVTSSPFHGYFVDGVKYFNYENGNTVNSNVVTEAQGAALIGTIGYLAEGARTNLLLQSNSLTTTWVQVGTPVTTQNVTGPDGATSAWTLTDNAAGTAEGIEQALALTAATHTLSIFVKKTVGAQSAYPVVSVATAGGNAALVTIDTSNGIATAWTASTGKTIVTSSATCENFNTDYWRISLTFAATVDTWYVDVFPAGTTNATQSTGVVDVAAQGSAVFYGSQLEVGAFASSYQPTTTAAVARNADVLTCPSAGLLENSIGAAYAEIATTWTGTPSTNFTATNPNIVSTFNSANGGVPLYITRTNNAVLLYDDTSGRVGPAFSGSSSIQKVASSWGGSTCSIAVNGTLSSGLTFDGNMNFTNTIAFGCWTDGTYNLFGVIKSIKLYKQKPADAQLQAMTT